MKKDVNSIAIVILTIITVIAMIESLVYILNGTYTTGESAIATLITCIGSLISYKVFVLEEKLDEIMKIEKNVSTEV